MIKTLYSPFQKWTEKGTLWVYSDPHFSDPEMVHLRKNYIGDEEQIARINSKVGKNDTIIILGDIGNEEMIRKIRGYKVLIMGNHDKGASKYQRQKATLEIAKYCSDKNRAYDLMTEKYPGWKIDIGSDVYPNPTPFERWTFTADNCLFDEVYEGPLFIAEKLVLSHEPIDLVFAFNIHGHDHSNWHADDGRHLNVCAEHIDYYPVNVGRLLKNGLLSKVESIHRITIDRAVAKKEMRTMKVTGWTWWDDERYTELPNEMYTDELRQTIAEELRDNGYKFSGYYHQDGDYGVPIINDKWLYRTTYRGWGHMMFMAYPDEIDNCDNMGYCQWAWGAPEPIVIPKGE